ncbi:LuxR C-terminal-related transcriptional regulator [Flavobacterium sp. SUN046]|uniref:LuxR C-terminal-related transcriptional regulator n=1 Tax=Flavobacterium sp. SUN046 TaxID=3002440 RepID=UPI002DC04106|nr:LuxR C-terminal-related transcriptional regulator [Flavobacterium sp. SUN046]MEC4050475.1 LuxR C-terminal-related transcriptional regulator [Flavobacterium sp. SUN046]
MNNIYDEMLMIERKLGDNHNIPSSVFDSTFFNKIEQIFSIGDYYYFVIDVISFSLEFIHENQTKVLGYPKDQISLEFLIEKIHPDDAPTFLNYGTEIAKFYASLPKDKVMKYKTRYDYRARRSDGSYIRILHQGLPIQTDDNGGMIRKLIIHTDISHYKKDTNSTLSFIGLDGEPSYLNVNVNKKYKATKNILSVREKQILIFFAEGKSRLEISNKLFISKFTLDNHRKNMLQKTESNSINELVSKAINEGWI